jgi:hypothetical protein
MFKLTKTDKKVIDAFLDQRPAESKKLWTNGVQLDGLWMGGTGVAEWRGRKIVFRDLGSRAAQTVQRAIEKKAPRNWLAGFSGRGSATQRFFEEQFDPQQEQMLDVIILMATNNPGAYRGRRAARAVDEAIEEYLRERAMMVHEDAQIIRRAAVREVQRQWRQR